MIEKILKKHLGNFKINNLYGYSPTCGITLRTLTVYHIINGKSCHCIRYDTFYSWKALKKDDIYLETVKELQQLDYKNTLDELEQIGSDF